MTIVVLIKQVPDMEKVRFDQESGRVDRTSAGTEINPFDLNALEAALRVKDELDCRVVALSMGPMQAKDALREAIARGADEGILLSDAKFGGADVKATSSTLVAAIRKLGGADLIFAGIQTVDGDTGQVGPEVAGYLGIPNISNVEEIRAFDEGRITAVSNIWDGLYLKRAAYPVLLTVTKDANEPRLPTFKNKMAARKAEIPVWGHEALKEYIDQDRLGLKGSPTKVKRIQVPPPLERKGQVWREDYGQAVDAIIRVCKDLKVLEAYAI